MSTPAHDPNEAFLLRLAEVVAREIVDRGGARDRGIIQMLAVVLADVISGEGVRSWPNHAGMARHRVEIMRQFAVEALNLRIAQNATAAAAARQSMDRESPQ